MKVTTPLNIQVILEQGGYIPHYQGRGMIRWVGKSKFHAYILGEVLDIHYDKDKGGYHSAGNTSLVWPELRRLGFNKSHILK